MNKYSVNVAWSDRDGMFVARCPEWPDVSALGDSYQEAVAEFGIALELTIETYKEDKWKLPEEQHLSEHSGQFRLRVPRSLHSWLAAEADRQGVSLNSFVTVVLSEARGSHDIADRCLREFQRAISQLPTAIDASVRSAVTDLSLTDTMEWTMWESSVFKVHGTGDANHAVKSAV